MLPGGTLMVAVDTSLTATLLPGRPGPRVAAYRRISTSSTHALTRPAARASATATGSQ